MSKNKSISTPFGDMTLKVSNYLDNSRLAIQIYTIEDDELWCDLTINLPEFLIDDIDEGFIKGDANSTLDGVNIVKLFKKAGVIQESYGMINYNMGKYEYVKFDLEKLREFDPKGVNSFEEKRKDNFLTI